MSDSLYGRHLYKNVNVAIGSFADGDHPGQLSTDDATPANEYRWTGDAWIQVGANGGIHVLAGLVSPLGYEQITSLSSAASLTPPTGAVRAVIQAEAQTVRYRDDGTSPTASVGTRLLADDTILYTGDLTAIELIEEVAGAKVNVHYY